MPGDACLDPNNGQFYVYIDSYAGWVLVDSCGNKKITEEQEREEVHAKFPQLARIWEEYQLMKKLCVGDNPRKDNAKR